MVAWNIKYLDEFDDASSLEEVFNDLNDEKFKAIAKELRLLELRGSALRLPHSRALGSGLFELRERRFGYRIYYIFSDENEIILLHLGIKDSQEKDIKKAYRYLRLLRSSKL